MTVYRNKTPNAAVSEVEFTPVSDGNFSFYYVDNPLKTEGVKQWLASSAVGQEIIAETDVNGHHVLVTHGDKSQDELLGLLAEKGDRLQLHHQTRGWKEFAWPTRSILGFTGQGMQLTSSFMRGKVDVGLMVFALSNIAANTMALTMGAQRTEDTHRLRFLKHSLNEDLQEHLPSGEVLPGPDDKRAALRNSMREPLTAGEKVQGFLQRNSVMVGELGLRYLGAFALSFPMNKWKAGFGKLKAGAFKEAYEVTRNDSKLSVYAGLGSMLGKTIAFGSKAEDPYNPKPKTLLDTIREKYTFRVGGWIETASFATLAYDGFTNKTPHRQLEFGGKKYRDFISGTGASLFTAAYITRHWAKFGEKRVNMEELSAHVSDSLAKMPPEKLPQLMADTAAAMKEHFKDKPMDFGKIFTELMTDLYRYHHIALDNLGTEPEERVADAGDKTKKIMARQSLKSSPRPSAAPLEKPIGHVEKLQVAAPVARISP